MRTTKNGITFHNGQPAVNVKIYRAPGVKDFAMLRSSEGAPASFDADWINAHLDDDEREWFWQDACEAAWEQLENDVNGENVFGRRVAVYSDGRSGGWAKVAERSEKRNGIGRVWTSEDVEGWDAVAVARWAKFEKFARQTADDVPYQYLWQIYTHRFTDWYEDQTINRPARELLKAAEARVAAEYSQPAIEASATVEALKRGALELLRNARGHLTTLEL